ncbi:formate dehydrogenase subunit alpha [Vibrio sp. SM6]|uniref:Formate dehydrogenase subunit alpha n=1 Tax=Vibrio agarilyticus TaxID=2726741 RepID=A0A7X8TU22_9VIBR|nr:formate dehydrogenase subunit alpha [Vibrio agarilyticus]NLS14809.1 formate dehydrogenase subunit alpha [Vibrio agarilyticus]
MSTDAFNKKSTVSFTLDDKKVVAYPGESIWQVAKRHHNLLPHLCFSEQTGYRADGNCRACMVEIEGEHVLAASCMRYPTENMVVHTQTDRAIRTRKMVMELLTADQPVVNHDASSHFHDMQKLEQITQSRFPPKPKQFVPAADTSHVAIGVNLDACIECNLCQRACREVQVNHVIGMAHRGPATQIVFDQQDELSQSTCVACGECVQVCPTGALMPANLLNQDGEGDRGLAESKTKTICPYCGVGCQIEVATLDKKIAYIQGMNGPSNHQRLCVKGRFGYDYREHSHRLTKPLIRKPNTPKGLNVDPANPLQHFREATWEEALTFAANGLLALREQHGGESVAGFGSAKCTNEEAYLFQKLIRQAFGHNNVEHCTRLCHASSVKALMDDIGSGAVTATFNEIEHADFALVIGCNPPENHPVAATFLKQFARRGGELVVADPRSSAFALEARHHLRFNPSTDVALLNAMMHVIVRDNLQNEQYIEQHTENWPALKSHLQQQDLAQLSSICGIAIPVIEEVARHYANAKAAMIFWGMGVSQHSHGTDNCRALISLALMCGHIGRAGTGLHPLRGQNNVQGASDAGLMPMYLPDYKRPEDEDARSRLNQLWRGQASTHIGVWSDGVGYPIHPTSGLTAVEIIDAASLGEIKGMYIAGENPAMSDPNSAHVRKALATLEHLVVQDLFVTETANFADVILPAATFFEKNGTVTNTNRQVQMARQVLPPPSDAREDWRIIIAMAERMGLNWSYTSPAQIFEEMTQAMPSLHHITWQRLEKENSIIYPCLSEESSGESVVFGDAFPRPSSRAHFSPVTMLPPAEMPDDEYPLVLTTGRQLEHWHTGTMTRRSHVLDSVEPEANCSMHPSTIDKVGVSAGEQVKLTTRRGSVTVMVRADTAVAPDLVFLPFAYVEAAANMLTNPVLDPEGKIPEFKYSAVRVEPINAPSA